MEKAISHRRNRRGLWAASSMKRRRAKTSARWLRSEMIDRVLWGRIKLEGAVSMKEGTLAAKDLPKNKATRPDLIPPEIYYHCPSLNGSLATLFTTMLGAATILRHLMHLCIILLRKPERDQPVALLSSLMKMLGLGLAKRTLSLLGDRLPMGQNA